MARPLNNQVKTEKKPALGRLKRTLYANPHTISCMGVWACVIPLTHIDTST